MIFKTLNFENIVSQYGTLNNAVNRYNSLSTKSTSFQEKYNATLANSQSSIGKYLSGLNGAKASINGYIGSLITARLKTIALQIASTALNVALTMGVSLAIQGVVTAITNLVNAEKQALEKSIELTNAYKEEHKSLDGQIESYEKLQKELEQSNLTTEESKSIKEQLLSIQDSLIESYDIEALSLDSTNSKYKDQLETLKAISKEKAEDFVTKNFDTYNKAKNELDKKRHYNIGSVGTNLGASELGYYFKNYDNDKIKLDSKSYGYGVTEYSIEVVANVEDAENSLKQLYLDVEQFGKDNNIDVKNVLEKISKQSNDVWTEELINYKTIFDEFVMADIKRNDLLGELYQQSINAVDAYNKALSSGNGIEEAKANLDSIQSKVKTNTQAVEGASHVFDNLFNKITTGSKSVTDMSATVVTLFDISSYKEQIDTLQSSLSSLSSAQEKLTKGNLSSSEVLDLLQEFPQLIPYVDMAADGFGDLSKGLNKIANIRADGVVSDLISIRDSLSETDKIALDTAINALQQMQYEATNTSAGVLSVSDALSALVSNTKLIDTIKEEVKEFGYITSTTLTNIASKYPMLENVVADYLAGLASTEDVLDSLRIAYDRDVSNYNKAILEKKKDDKDFYKSIVENLSDDIIEKNKQYRIDLENYESLSKAKLEIEKELARKIAVLKSSTNKYESSINDADNGRTLNPSISAFDDMQDAEKELEDFKKVIDETNLEINNILNLKNYKGLRGEDKYKSTKGSSFSNQIDWINESVNKLKTEMKRYQSILDNTSSISNQIKYTKKLISTQSQLKTAYSKSSDAYSKKYNNALNKLSLEDQDKVKNGTYSIESFKDKNVKSGETGVNEERFNNIQDAIKLRDAFNDSNLAIIQADTQLKEYAKSLATIRWDKANEKCEKLTKDIELLNAEMENSVGYKAENRYLNKILDKYKDIYNAKKKAVKDTNNDIKSTKNSINKKYKTKDRINSNGTLKTTGITNSSQLGYITEYNALILQQIENNKELKISEQELKSTIADNATAKFDNIANYYDQRTGIVDKKKERLDKELDILEAKGLSAGKAYYEELIRLESANVDYLNKELSKLQTQLDNAVRSGDVTKYSPKWYDMVNAIYDVKSAIQDCTLNTIEFKKAIDQIGFDNLDNLVSRLSSLQKESDFLIDLMSNTTLIGKDGKYTDTGLATQGQHAQNYNNYMYQADEYAKQLKAWDSKYGNLKVDDENYNYYIEKREELIASQQELIKSAESEKKAMIDLAKEGIQVQIDAYKEAINMQKELLDAEKDLADFQKSLTKKRQNAAMIQKRLNAISGDDSDEKRKLRKQLEKELAEAKDDLESFEKDKYIQNQKKDLDESVTQYEKDMKDYMKNTDLIFSETLSTINASSNSIANTIKNTASNVGYSISSQITSAWTTAGTSVTAYSSKFQTASVGMLSILSQIKDAYDKAAISAEALAKAKVSAIKSDNSSTTSSTVSTLSKSKRESIEKILNNGEGSGKGTSDLNKYITDVLGKKNQISYEQAVQLAKLLGISGVTKKEDMIGNTAKKNEILEALKRAGFRKGGIVGDINHIIKGNGDHGIATVRTDEVILDPKESKVFKDFVKLSPDFLNTMNPLTKYGINDSIRKEDNAVQQGINVTITAPLVNVENMDENMLYKMKNDKKIQQTMQDIVLGQSISGIKNTSSGRNLRR